MSNQAKMQIDDREGLRQSFMRLGLPRRLGELAAGLSTVRSVIEQNGQQNSAWFFLDESARFIEWLAPDVQSHWQADWLKLKQELATWLADWPATWNNVEQRNAVATQTGLWCDKFVQHSGLLDPEVNPR